MKTTRRAVLKLMTALFAGLATVSIKAQGARERVANELFRDPQRFWDWWDKNVGDRETLNVTIIGDAKTGKSTLATQVYARQTGVTVEARWVRRVDPSPGGLNMLAFEDDQLLDNRSFYMGSHNGCRVNVRRIDMRGTEHLDQNDARVMVFQPWDGHDDELKSSDIVMFTYRIPGTDKFRVRVIKFRWGTTDDLVFCLS